MCLTTGVTISDSTTEIQILLSSQYTIGASEWSAKDSMYLWITFSSLQICTCIYFLHQCGQML